MTRPNHPAMAAETVDQLATDFASLLVVIELANDLHDGFGEAFVRYAIDAHATPMKHDLVAAIVAQDLPDTVPADWA